MPGDLVVLSELEMRYPRAAEPAVRGIDLAVREGCFFGLLGPNGAGKTTLLSMLCGLLVPGAGTIRIAGRDATGGSSAARRLLGYVPQELALYESLSARENLGFFASMQGLRGSARRARVEACLEAAGMGAHAERRVAHFSGGLKRRLNLAVGLLHEPLLLVLDEPTVGVDPQSRNHLFDLLRGLHRAGATIVYTTHYMEEVEELCEEVAILDHGRVIARGPLGELLGARAGARLELRLSAAPDAQALADLAALHGAGSIRVEGRALYWDVDPDEGLLEPTLALLRGRGLELRSLTRGTASLGELFLQLTGKRLRD